MMYYIASILIYWIMKITSRGYYGLRFLVDLAVHENDGPVSLSDVAERQGISEKYLWQVVAPLKSGGFVEAVRGAQGGYRLSQPAAKINLRSILAELESSARTGIHNRKLAGRDRDAGAVARAAIQSLATAWDTAAEAITLDSLAEEHRKLKSSGALMYEI